MTMSENYYISTSNSGAPIDRLRIPKVIARISLCGAIVMSVTEDMDWNPPTPEQIKNLKETFNIDVRLVEDKKNE